MQHFHAVIAKELRQQQKQKKKNITTTIKKKIKKNKSGSFGNDHANCSFIG